MARLIVIDGAARGTEHELGPTQRIGRLQENEIAVDDPAMSRHHTRVWRLNEAWWIEDLDSRNGTLVNDERIDRRRLVDGDRVTIGGTGFAFVDDAPAARTPEVPAAPPRREPRGPAGPSTPRGPGASPASRFEPADGAPEIRRKPSDKRLTFSPHAGRPARGVLGQDLAQYGGLFRVGLIVLALAAAAGLFWLVQAMVAGS